MPHLAEKRLLLAEYEESIARQLAGNVMEKPTPPIWMILIPVFFVFYAWKLSDYKKGLKNFVANYLIARERALDLACTAIEENRAPAIDRLMTHADTLPEKAKPLYRDWISLQTEHYRNLLLAAGATVPEQVRNHYRTKANFLLVSNRLSAAENRFNSSLVPEITGDSEDLQFIAERIERFNSELRRLEVERIFS